jgi:hypothetical protein
LLLFDFGTTCPFYILHTKKLCKSYNMIAVLALA